MSKIIWTNYVNLFSKGFFMAAKKAGNISEERLAIYDKIIEGMAGVERKGATMPYTSVNGHMFSFLAPDGSLALRLPDAGRTAFIKKHNTRLCEAHGAVLKEYVVVPDKVLNDASKMAAYFRASYEYVKSLKPKPTTKPAVAKKPVQKK
jgi:hypothetical protein